jgi:hypothetical protein
MAKCSLIHDTLCRRNWKKQRVRSQALEKSPLKKSMLEPSDDLTLLDGASALIDIISCNQFDYYKIRF